MKIIYSKYAFAQDKQIINEVMLNKYGKKIGMRLLEIALLLSAMLSTAALFAQNTSTVNITNQDADMSSIKEMDVKPGTGTTQVMWKVQGEIKPVIYVIERSVDSFNFLPMGKVKGIPSADAQTYSYTDKMPLAGAAFYRMIKIESNGSYNYSGIYSINEGAPEMAIGGPEKIPASSAPRNSNIESATISNQ